MYMYNSLLLKRKQEYKIPLNNTITLNSLNIKENELIDSSEIKIKFISPLLVRKRENGKDTYLDYTSKDFNNQLNQVVMQFIETLQEKFDNTEISLTPIKASRTIVKNMGLKFNASYGEFLLKGDKKLLNYLLESGIGSRRGEGFGMFKVLSNEK